MDLSLVMESVDYIKSKIDYSPEVAIILGSGLGDLAEEVEEKVVVKYSEVPHLPVSTVKGHAGQFVFGKLKGKKVVMMQGRFHYYEGYDVATLSFPIYILKYLGAEKLIVTNAAGGVNTDFEPGDLMLIKDHVNLAFNNPLIGKNDDKIGQRFPDMSEPYDKKFLSLAREVAKNIEVKLQEGSYFWFTGPTYETPAEIKMARILGGDAVGMSTVPEVIAARHCGIRVLGISCITNMAAGILDKPLNHNEVIETSNRVKHNFIALVNAIVEKI